MKLNYKLYAKNSKCYIYMHQRNLRRRKTINGIHTYRHKRSGL